MLARALTLLVASILAAPPAVAATLLRLDGVPAVRADPGFEGEACAEMILRALGRPDLDREQVFQAAGLHPSLGRGCRPEELLRALTRLRLDAGPGAPPAGEGTGGAQAAWAALREDLAAGLPSIVVLMTAPTDREATPEDRPEESGFRLVVGYDPAADEVIYHDPSGGAYQHLGRAEFLGAWSGWRVRVRSRQGEPAQHPEAARSPEGFTPFELARKVRQVRQRLDAPGFTVLVEPPFVVIGDEAPAVVRRRSDRTVRWATDHLRKLYFPRDPARILEVWLFRDEASYRSGARRLFGHEPTTPFGYYSSQEGALIMNIGTGGGTLVHEIVHPFMEANFPDCPAWFNEGLGSLYEQCGEVEGQIRGRTNWRLAGLQKAIESGAVPSLARLLATTDHQFYRQDRGNNYAAARYLCYYLQEKGKLVEFYRRFLEDHEKDPTGLATLEAVLEIQDLESFQRRWESFVSALTFP